VAGGHRIVVVAVLVVVIVVEEEEGGEEEGEGRRCNYDVVMSSSNFEYVVFTSRSIPSKTRRCTMMLPCALGLKNSKYK
jgi:hypothetical protein